MAEALRVNAVGSDAIGVQFDPYLPRLDPEQFYPRYAGQALDAPFHVAIQQVPGIRQIAFARHAQGQRRQAARRAHQIKFVVRLHT